VRVAEHDDPTPGPRGLEPGTRRPAAQMVRLSSGGLATSSTTCRQWQRAGQSLHHIVDPRTGLPADGPWRTASVVAASCAAANAASTAAIVAGEQAEGWLAAERLPARLVGHDGTVRLVAGWPDADGGALEAPKTAWLTAGHASGSTRWSE